MNETLPFQEIYDRLLNGQTLSNAAMTSRLPLPYHLVPGKIRVLLAKLIFRAYACKEPRKDRRHPCSYADDSVDRLAREISLDPSRQGGRQQWSWPDEKICALVLSHDVDTAGQQKGIRMLRELAQARGITSTFSFVGRFLSHYAPLISALENGGFDVALHDVVHDNRIAFLSKNEIVARLSVVMEKVKKGELTGFRSPSWFTSPALWSALESAGFLYDMSALDTFPLLSRTRHCGVSTFFPFMVASLVVLPNTIPFEMPWFCGYKTQETFEFWKPKIDRIACSGGLIMINAHPERWYCGNRRAMEQLERCIDYILATHDPAPMNAAEAARHTLGMRNAQAMLSIGDAPRLCVPHHAAQQPLPDPHAFSPCNPLAVHPREFLKKTAQSLHVH